MNLFEEAIIYSTVMHTGAKRKLNGSPYILHPMEVAQIISTITDDIEVITAGVLHDVVEDTDGSAEEIRKRFGDRVADLVASETEKKGLSWMERKQESILALKNTKDKAVKILWLADKLSNIRSFARGLNEKGNDIWQHFHMSDPEKQRWYYKSIAEILEIDLNRTGAYKEFIQHINEIWPGTFDPAKQRYKKFREISIDGCKVIGKGAKGTVYRYDDELIVKVYNSSNTFKDIERENDLAKKAFVAGIPTAISFGIVQVGDSYGSMFELLDSKSVSELMSANQSNLPYYAKQMADLANIIHSTSGEGMGLNNFRDEVYSWIKGGIAHEDEALTERITKMVDALPEPGTVIHGDFHSGNVMVQKDEFLLIDMDRFSVCHPIVEICSVYMAYVAFGKVDPSITENFHGISCKTAEEFFHLFLKYYLKTDDEKRIQEVTDKAALLTWVRLVRRAYKKGTELSPENQRFRDVAMAGIQELLPKVDSFDF